MDTFVIGVGLLLVSGGNHENAKGRQSYPHKRIATVRNSGRNAANYLRVKSFEAFDQSSRICSDGAEKAAAICCKHINQGPIAEAR